MNTLLIFFALPLATIILAIVLQKLIKCPILVAAIFFAIYLIVAFAVFDATFLIAAIVYTFLAYVTASIVRIICCFIRNCNWNCDDDNCICSRSNTSNNAIVVNDTNELSTLSNRNVCRCRVSSTNLNSFNNGYNRGYNNGYDNGYNNAVDFCNNESISTTNNISTLNNNCGCNCRRRFR